MEAVKAVKFEITPKKKVTSGIRYDARTMTLRGHQLTLSCIGRRLQAIITIPAFFRETASTGKLKGGTLTYQKRSNRFFFQLTYELPRPEPKTEGEIVGLDRGLYNLVATSEGEFYSGNKIRASQRRYLYNRKTLQAKGTPSSRRRLRRMSGREKRFSRQVNHEISKKLANDERVAVYVFEDLSSIRVKSRGRKMNKWLGSWPFFQLETFTNYKCEARGKRTVFGDPRYTSQKCNRCGYKEKLNRKGGLFLCRQCGNRDHADTNAAKNHRDDYILSLAARSGEQAAVNPPNATDVSSVASSRACLVSH